MASRGVQGVIGFLLTTVSLVLVWWDDHELAGESVKGVVIDERNREG